jgi:spermidine synthase
MIESPAARSTTAAETRRILPILLLLFIGSGSAALIYEIVWLQLLQLVIGSTAVSLGVLLGTYMGGMCLGSLLLPRLIPTRHHPLMVYAVLELIIGVCGLAIVWLGMPAVEHIYTAFGNGGVSGIVLRALLAAVCLIPPTLCMGATLPAIGRYVETSREGVSWMGFFYGGNIAGAVFGSLYAGFYLLPNYDMPYATHVAAAINVGVAILAAILTGFSPFTAPDEARAKVQIARAPGAWTVYVAIALSGFSALGAEVVWLRLMGLMLGGTVYTFSNILAVFLVGLGIGSSVGSITARNVSPRAALGACQLLLVAGLVWTAYMITYSLPYWPVNPQISLSPWYTFQLDLARCFWAILPGTLLWGASFPLALAAVSSPGQDPGRLVGGVYAANTVGAIAGSLLFSMVIIPAFGTQGAQRWLIAIAVAGAVFAWLPLLLPENAAKRPSGSGVRNLGFAAALLVALIASVAMAKNWVSPPYWGMVAYGRYSATWAQYLVPGIIPESQVPQNNGSSDTYCEYVGEGMNVSVAVTMTTAGIRSFHGAGKVQASNDPQDMRLQRMLGHISVLAHQNPDKVKKVLVVACGAGVTAGSFIPYDGITDITICDIEPLVPTTVTPRFWKENYSVVGAMDTNGKRTADINPRVHVVYDDGRHFIRTTKEKFDIITSDPIDPWVKGCAALNTVEYYQMAKDHLNPGGVVSLWIPIYESNDETIKSVLSTFFQVFPNGILWSNDIRGEGYDAVLFGRADSTQIDVDKMQTWLDEHPKVNESLQQVGFRTAVDLLATYAGDAHNLQPWMQGAQINTDRNLRLQYLAGKALNTYNGRAILDGILKYCTFPKDLFTGSPAAVASLQNTLQTSGRLKALPSNKEALPIGFMPGPPTTP